MILKVAPHGGSDIAQVMPDRGDVLLASCPVANDSGGGDAEPFRGGLSQLKYDVWLQAVLTCA